MVSPYGAVGERYFEAGYAWDARDGRWGRVGVHLSDRPDQTDGIIPEGRFYVPHSESLERAAGKIGHTV